MDDKFSIYIDRLNDGKVEKLSLTLDPDFIDLDSDELSFQQKVELEGEAYLADDELIIHWTIAALATMPCKICNDKMDVKVRIENSYHTVSLKEIKGSIYSLKEPLREQILLACPEFAECCDGNCPKREFLKKYSEKMPPQENPFSKL